jgi:acetyl-CoA C-acetyltransferase
VVSSTNVDGAFANRDAVALSVPAAQAMASRVKGPIDFAVWGWVVQNLNYANLAREIWFDAKLDPHVPSFTTVMQCSTSMVGVFEAVGILASRAQLVMAGAELHHKTVGSVRGQSPRETWSSTARLRR